MNNVHSLLHIWGESLSRGQKNTEEQVTEPSQQPRFSLTAAPFGLADGTRLVARDKESGIHFLIPDYLLRHGKQYPKLSQGQKGRRTHWEKTQARSTVTFLGKKTCQYSWLRSPRPQRDRFAKCCRSLPEKGGAKCFYQVKACWLS